MLVFGIEVGSIPLHVGWHTIFRTVQIHLALQWQEKAYLVGFRLALHEPAFLPQMDLGAVVESPEALPLQELFERGGIVRPAIALLLRNQVVVSAALCDDVFEVVDRWDYPIYFELGVFAKDVVRTLVRVSDVGDAMLQFCLAPIVSRVEFLQLGLVELLLASFLGVPVCLHDGAGY